MANKLGLTNEVKEIKLGKSFSKEDNTCFHTFRYDFMPASVDPTKRADVNIGEGHQVTVTVPHIEGSGTSNTVFKGSKKPYQKECVLIIDHSTGEITLEKLSFNVQVKKTRAEGSSKMRSNTPVEPPNFNSKKSPTTNKHSPQRKSTSFGRSSPVQKCSPLPKSPINNQQSPNGPSMPSLNLLSSAHVRTPTIPEVHVVPAEEAVEAAEVGVLSSSSSSSAESSDSSDDEEKTPAAKLPSKGISNGFNESPKKKESMVFPSSSNNLSMPTVNSLPSMPKFVQLSEDLQLSESDSDY